MLKRKAIILWGGISCLFVVILVFGWLLLKSSHPKLIASGHPEWPPIMWQEGNDIVGIGPALLKMICTEINIQCDIKYQGQWQAVQKQAKAGKVDMLVAAYKTTEREQYMDYSIAYTVDPITLFVKSGQDFNYSRWESLIGKKGVITIGDSYGQDFDNFLQEKLTVEKVATVEEAFDVISSGKADYFVYATYSGQRELAKLNLIGQIESIADDIASENFYFAISKKSPYLNYLPQINQLIKKYQTDGTIKKLLEEYTNKN